MYINNKLNCNHYSLDSKRTVKNTAQFKKTPSINETSLVKSVETSVTTGSLNPKSGKTENSEGSSDQENSHSVEPPKSFSYTSSTEELTGNDSKELNKQKSPPSSNILQSGEKDLAGSYSQPEHNISKNKNETNLNAEQQDRTLISSFAQGSGPEPKDVARAPHSPTLAQDTSDRNKLSREKDSNVLTSSSSSSSESLEQKSTKQGKKVGVIMSNLTEFFKPFLSFQIILFLIMLKEGFTLLPNLKIIFFEKLN